MEFVKKTGSRGVGMAIVFGALVAVALLIPHHARSVAAAGAVPRATVNPDKARNTVVNGGFEATTGWTKVGAVYATSEGTVRPERGTKLVSLRGGSVAQTVKIPSTAPYLRYSYQIRGTRSACGMMMSIFAVTIKDVASTSSKDDMVEICSSQVTTAWKVRTIDLRSWAGRSVKLTFTEVAMGSEVLVLDDIGFVSGATRPVDYY